MRWLTPSPSLPRLVRCHFLSLLVGNGPSDQRAWDSLDTSSICVCVLASQQAFLTCMLLGSFLIPLHYKPSLSGTPNTVEILMRRCPICHDMLLTCYEDKQQIGSTCHTNVTNKFYMDIKAWHHWIIPPPSVCCTARDLCDVWCLCYHVLRGRKSSRENDSCTRKQLNLTRHNTL